MSGSLVSDVRGALSIHAPARGAIKRGPFGGWRFESFNPRSRTGSDRLSWGYCSDENLSIHAPARGAILRRHGPPPGGQLSIHAPARGAILPSYHHRRSPKSFNPRSRTGSDVIMVSTSSSKTLSIHAPARGAIFIQDDSSPGSIFQSTLPHGERYHIAKPDTDNLDFQSTLPHGERWSKRLLQVPFFSFNPRSRTGSDLSGECITDTTIGFQSTLPHGER